MTIGRGELGALMGRLVSASPQERDEASSVVRDWSRWLDEFERRSLIRLIALLASHESDPTARESELAALSEISGPRAMTRGDVEPVFEIAADDLDPSEREYVQGIREVLEEADRFWLKESPVICDALSQVEQELVTTHPGLRWRSSYEWPLRVFPVRAHASVLPSDGGDHSESIELYAISDCTR